MTTQEVTQRTYAFIREICAFTLSVYAFTDQLTDFTEPSPRGSMLKHFIVQAGMFQSGQGRLAAVNRRTSDQLRQRRLETDELLLQH
jgi:hypothetical protein